MMCELVYYCWYLAAGLLTVVVAYEVRERLRNNPPTPFRLPIFGNLLLQINPLRIGQDFLDLSKKLGSPLIYTKVYIPGIICREAIIVNDPKIGEHVLSNPEFNNRPKGFSKVWETILRPNGVAIATDLYKDHKRMMNAGMFIKQNMTEIETYIYNQTEKLVERWNEQTGKSFNPYQELVESVMETALYMLYSKEENDEESARLAKMFKVTLDEAFEQLYFEKAANLCDLLISVRDSLPFMKFNPVQKLEEIQEKLLDQTSQFVKIVKNRGESSSPNLVQYLLDCGVSESSVIGMCNDALLAGVHTTSGAVSWFVLLAGLYPQVIQNIKQEIDREIGEARPEFSHISSMHYTWAAVWETMRFRWVGVLYLPHTTTKNTELGGYTVRANTPVVVNSDCIYYDPELWKNPNEFDPNNFINADGIFFKPKSFGPFGLANRHCSGEPLAVRQLFIHIVSIVRSFKWTIDDSNVKHSLDKMASLSMPPMPYEISLSHW